MLKEVRRHFGKRVADVVDGCTDADTYPSRHARAEGNIHLAPEKSGCTSAGFRRRQAQQRALDSQRLPAIRRISLVKVQRWTRGHSLVLSDFAGRISPRPTESHYSGPRMSRERTGTVDRPVSSHEWRVSRRSESADCSPPVARGYVVARTIDQIRASKLPSNTMQFAARGALQVPSAENIEILVYLAVHN